MSCRSFQKRIGVTTIYVTHDQVEAMGLGDRIAVMNEGKLRQLGTPEEVYGKPADTFVATFVGSPPMNLIRQDGVILGFRPEALLPASQRSGDGLTLSVDVQRVEYLGSERHVLGKLSGDVGQSRVTGVLPAAVPLEVADGKDQAFFVPARSCTSSNPSPANAPTPSLTKQSCRAERYRFEQEGVLAPLLLAPAILYIFALVAVPFFLAIAYSLSDVTVGDPSLDFVGLENFRRILDDAGLPPIPPQQRGDDLRDDGSGGSRRPHPRPGVDHGLSKASGWCAF